MRTVKGLIVLGSVLSLMGCPTPPRTPQEAEARQDRMMQMLEDTSTRNQNQLPKADDEVKASWRGRPATSAPDMPTAE